MALPSTWKTVTVTATYTRADTAGPAAGSVQFTPVKAVGIAADVVLPGVLTATLNGSGQITVALPCPNAAGETGMVYEVIERVPGGRSYYIEVLASMTGTVVLGDLAPLTDDQAAYYSLQGPVGPAGTSLLRPVGTLAIVGGVVTVDLAYVECWELELSANVTGWAFVNKPPAGKKAEISIDVVQNASSAKTCVSPASAGRTAGPAWSPSAVLGARETLVLVVDSAGTVALYTGGVQT